MQDAIFAWVGMVIVVLWPFYFLARLTKSRGSYCRTPGVCRRHRRRCRRRRRRPHLVKGCLQALIISINLTILYLCLP